MLYVDDKLSRHPKIFRAGSLLGKNGPAQALALFLDGLSYARAHLTDGFIPDDFVASCALVERGLDVARVLVDRRVRLWHRVKGGYQIHDYHDWNRSALEIKKKREQERLKKQRQRRNGNGEFEGASPEMSPRDLHRDSRARASTIHVPRTTSTSIRMPVQAEGKNERYASTDLPALTRRDSCSLLKSSASLRFEAPPHDQSSKASRMASAVCDHTGDAAGDADDRRRRVESAHQGSPDCVGPDLSEGNGRHRSSDASSGSSAREAGPRQAAADGGEAAATTAPAAARSAVALAEWPDDHRTDVATRDSGEPSQLRHLRATLAAAGRRGVR